MLVLPERMLAVLVMISSKSAPICNRFHARLVDSGINIRLMINILCAGCLNLSPAISVQ